MSGQVPESKPRTDFKVKNTFDDIKGKCHTSGQVKWYDIVVACRNGKRLVFYNGWTKLTIKYSRLQALMYNSVDPITDFREVCKDIGLVVNSESWSENEHGVPVVICRITEYGPV